MSSETNQPADETKCPEPEAIQECRKIIAALTEGLDRGEIEELSVYAASRDGSYRTFQSRNNGRHEDAGRILELAMIRLGFVQREMLPDFDEE